MKSDRQRGALLGLAVGDALGAAVEFSAPGRFVPVENYRSGGPHGLEAGEWTDDTSMALALADSIATVGWDLNDQARRYVAWWRHGEYSVNDRCFDIGTTTRTGLAKFERTGDARTSGPTSASASGNGSIMRLAPVPIAFGDRPFDELVRYAGESSLPTHGSPAAVSACEYLAVLLAGLMQGTDRELLLAEDGPLLSQLRTTTLLHPDISEIASGSFRRKSPPEIQGSGYVVRSLEAALWAFARAADFREAVLLAVNLGDDADTTGAICGQLAGAWWGEQGIPQEWRAGLARQEMLETPLQRLLAIS